MEYYGVGLEARRYVVPGRRDEGVFAPEVFDFDLEFDLFCVSDILSNPLKHIEEE